MTKYQKRHRIIATFFLLIFFPTIIPSNLFASNNGPVAPEATSFEPIDATDMVNLSTGDMSYVLPLLNVPSPEGGYPLSLSYHAGIAMDEEASWVGLGWSLNPGAINRSVKGVPDDWGKTRISELLYDEGQNLNYYNFSIGGTLPNGVTIGMSRAWGDHKAWGGIVSYGAASINLGSEGTSIGYSFYGISADYNLNSGKVSGAYGLSATGATQSSLSINTSGEVKASALGVSFSTATGKVTSTTLNANISNNSSTSASKSDYYINNSSKGFDLNLAGFYWIAYQHTKIEYSLFKLTSNYSSGTLNLFDSKNESGYLQNNNYYMDVRTHYVDDKNIRTSSGISPKVEVTLPNYDNYSVSAQGISGSFSPKIYDEIMLYGKGDDTNSKYLTTPDDQKYYRLNNSIFFNFDNVNSSFLRTQTGDFKSLDPTYNLNNNSVNPNGINEAGRFVNNIVTDVDNTFSSPKYKDGPLTKNGDRKNDGNLIQAYTNKEITSGKILEVPGYNRSFYTSIAENGIGAYRVTALDGKVYHYSLPVYNFEEVYKNYATKNNENDKFLETIKTKPYATHWLLTAITGPDYVDMNGNNKVDNEDYGYWVEFEYGKWSEGYGWRSPKIGGKVYNDKNIYFWGRKEIYYLDKIKTRTHTALFVKSIRNDNKSTSIQYRNGQYQSGPMPSEITQNFGDKLARPIETGLYYSEYQKNTHQLLDFNQVLEYKHRSYKYVDLPENLSLKLDKVILLKNTDASNVSKNLSTGTNRKKGYTYFDYGFWSSYSPNRKDPYAIKIADINTDQNVLDKEDISLLNQSQGFDIQTKAVKVINLNYDYTLGSNLPNASEGRLALRSVEFNGKENAKVIPPYKFNYQKSNTPYNLDNSDNWGYIKDNPDAWSLNEIITPIGTKIKVEYESDSFSREAAFRIERLTESTESYNRVYSPLYNTPVKHTIQDNIITVNTGFKVYADNLNDIFNLNQEVNLNFQFKDPNLPNYKEYFNNYTIIGIDNTNKKLTLKANDKTDLTLQKKFFEGPYCSITGGNGQFESYTFSYSTNDASEYALRFKIVANYNRLIAQFGRNGKTGGGLRVRKVTTSDFNNLNSVGIEYDYRNPYTTNVSGVTSFEPSDNPQIAASIQAVEEIPAPDVRYEYVTASIKNNSELLTSTIYNFKVMDDITLSTPKDEEYIYKFGDQFAIKFYGGSRRDFDSRRRQVSTSKVILYDNFASLGQLLSVKTYNKTQQLINRTINKYKEFQYNDIENGISQESFKYATRNLTNRNAIDANGNYLGMVQDCRYHFTSVSKTFFPSTLESNTVLKNGLSNTTYYDKYDFLTGQVVEQRIELSNGQTVKTKTIPAYHKYADMRNKNMLSQTAADYSYILDLTSTIPTWKETGVNITTWTNKWPYKYIDGTTVKPVTLWGRPIPGYKYTFVWRKNKSYVWNGSKDANGIFISYDSTTGSGDDNFIWEVGTESQPKQWKQVSEVTLYDHFSAPLETKDGNGNFASTKMGDNDTKIITTGNARYGEMFFSGAENTPPLANPTFLDPEVAMINASRNTAFYHTGQYSVAATSNSQFGVAMQSGEHRAGKYKVSVWVEKANEAKARINNNGTIINFTNSYSAGNWVLKTGYVDVPSGAYTIYVTSADGSTVYFDDLMIRPVALSITGYVYNEWDELSHIIANNGLATRYEYDSAGRLTRTYSEIIDDTANGVAGGFKLAKSHTYNNKFLNR